MSQPSSADSTDGTHDDALPAPNPTSPSLSGDSLSRDIVQRARQLGFDYCRIVPVASAPHASFFQRWIADGRAGEMTYLERNVEKRVNPALLADECSGEFRSIIVLGVNYRQATIPPEALSDPSMGVIASYAWSDDYHEVLRPLLHELDDYIRTQTVRTSLGKCLVDTGPVLERDWAETAGMGFTGKNCCSIDPDQGSWRFLATVMVPEILVDDRSLQHSQTDAEDRTGDAAPVDATFNTVGTCGECTRCLAACPTGAFTGAYNLDPKQCISYWTIEARGAIPTELRPHFGNRIFGCDICQEVCPYNRKQERLPGSQTVPERSPVIEGLRAHSENMCIPLLEGFDRDNPYWLDEAAFRKRFKRSPILRPKRRGMLRNVCVALGNWGSEEAGYALMLALQDDEPIVRGHAAWGLGQVADKHPRTAFVQALAGAGVTESDACVRTEIAAALRHAQV